MTRVGMMTMLSVWTGRSIIVGDETPASSPTAQHDVRLRRYTTSRQCSHEKLSVPVAKDPQIYDSEINCIVRASSLPRRGIAPYRSLGRRSAHPSKSRHSSGSTRFTMFCLNSTQGYGDWKDAIAKHVRTLREDAPPPAAAKSIFIPESPQDT